MIRVSRQRDILSVTERELVPWPATIRDLAPRDWSDLRCSRAGAEVPEAEWDQVLADGDLVHFYSLPGLIPVPFSVAVVAALNQIGLAIALSFIARLLLPTKKPNKRDEEDSANNSFSNLQSNDRFEGVPMPVIYGRRRIAPPIISQVVRTSLDASGNPVSEISLLMLLCDGEISAVGNKTADGGPFLSEDNSYVETLQINNQPAENFEDVEVHVRLGTDEQEKIEGFASPALQYSVGQEMTFPKAKHPTSSFPVTGAVSFSGGTGYTDGATVTLAGGTGTAATFRVTAPAGVPTALVLLTGGSYSIAPPSPNAPTGGGGDGALRIVPDFDKFVSAVGDSASDPTGGTNTPGTNTAIATPGVFAATHGNVTKWELYGTPVSYTMGEDADEFSALMSLPQGLGDFTSANPVANTVAYQARYRQVDGVGVPFGDYIVLDAERLVLARSGQFQIELRRRFFNPVGYAPPTFGQFLRGRTGDGGSTNRGASLALAAAQVPSRSLNDTDVSFACWVRTNVIVASAQRRRLMNWKSGNVGLALDLQTEALTGESSYLTVTIGDGVGSREVSHSLSTSDANLFDSTTAWVHVAVSIDGDGGGNGSAQILFFINGIQRGSSKLSGGAVRQLQVDGAIPWRVQSDASPSPSFGFNCDMDEPTLWSRSLSAFDVARLYNQRAPLSTAADALGLLAGGRFDGTTGTTGRASFGPAGGALWTLGDGTGGASPSANPDCSADPTAENGIVKALETGAALRGKFLIEIQRLTVEDEVSGVFSELHWDTIELASFHEFCYPGCALLAVRVRASEQLSGGSPLVTVRADGRLCPVWDGIDAVFPSTVPTFTRNPAWIACDILTNADYGLGTLYVARDLDMPAFQELADYCDELVFDNSPRILVVNAMHVDHADSATLPTALDGGASQDFVRYRVATLPTNWPQPGVASGRYMKPKITGNPSAPAWLTTEAAAVAQEIVYVEFVSTGAGFYYVWCKSSVVISATTAVFTPSVSSVNFVEVEHHDVRYRFDGVFDRADVPAWDALMQVLQVARAVPIKLGRRVSVFVDKPVVAPVALIGMGNVVEGSFRSSVQGSANRPNVEQAEFFDEDLNWERSFVTDELPDVTDPATQSAFNFRRIRLEGVTRRGQAKRHLRRDLNTFNLLRKVKSFKTAVNGLPLMPGDVIGLSHDVPGYGTSGRILNDSANQTSVKLDRPVVLAGATSYQVQVENAASNVRETKPVTSGAGSYAAGTAINVGGGGFTFTPTENDIYALGVVGAEAPLYRVIESTLDPLTLQRSIRAIEYNADVFDDDFGVLPASSPTNLPVPTAPTIPPGVENLVVDEGSSKGPDGHVRIVARLSFQHFASTFTSVDGVEIYVSMGTHDVGRAGAHHVKSLDRTSVNALLDYPFERNQTYTIWVVPRSVSGGHARVYATYSEFTPRGLSAPPKAPLAPRVVVAGEVAVHQWEDPGDIDHEAIVEVRQGGWILGVPVASAPAQARRTGPIAAWGTAPTNSRGAETPDLVARTKSRNGQYSEAALYSGSGASLASDDGAALSVSEEDAW